MKVAGDDDVARTHVLAEECRRLKADSGLNKISSPSVETLGFDISALPGLCGRIISWVGVLRGGGKAHVPAGAGDDHMEGLGVGVKRSDSRPRGRVPSAKSRLGAQ